MSEYKEWKLVWTHNDSSLSHEHLVACDVKQPEGIHVIEKRALDDLQKRYEDFVNKTKKGLAEICSESENQNIDAIVGELFFEIEIIDENRQACN